MIIHPNGSDPHSYAACPIFVISRLMRLEARIHLFEHLAIIHFGCHIVRSARSHLIDVHKHTLAIWLENNHFSAINYGTFEVTNVRDSFGNTLSDTRPYTFVLRLNETEGTISINRKSPCTLLRLRLSSYNLTRNATANTEWFSDNNPTGLSILTTILANTSIVGYLTIEEK